MRKYFIVLVAMATMLAIPHDALARTQKVDDRHMVITRKPKAKKKKAKKAKKKKSKKIDYGIMKCTAYCDCPECSSGYGRSTHSGTTAEAGRTIAVDPDVIDIGSKVEIEGETYIAEDVGSAVVGDHIDIFFDTHEEVEEWEVKYLHCWVVRE